MNSDKRGACALLFLCITALLEAVALGMLGPVVSAKCMQFADAEIKIAVLWSVPPFLWLFRDYLETKIGQDKFRKHTWAIGQLLMGAGFLIIGYVEDFYTLLFGFVLFGLMGNATTNASSYVRATCHYSQYGKIFAYLPYCYAVGISIGGCLVMFLPNFRLDSAFYLLAGVHVLFGLFIHFRAYAFVAYTPMLDGKFQALSKVVGVEWLGIAVFAAIVTCMQSRFGVHLLTNFDIGMGSAGGAFIVIGTFMAIASFVRFLYFSQYFMLSWPSVVVVALAGVSVFVLATTNIYWVAVLMAAVGAGCATFMNDSALFGIVNYSKFDEIGAALHFGFRINWLTRIAVAIALGLLINGHSDTGPLVGLAMMIMVCALAVAYSLLAKR